MKKILFTLSLVFSTFLLSHHVFASDYFNINYDLSGLQTTSKTYTEMQEFYNSHSSVLQEMASTLIDDWQENWSSTYPYYVLYFSHYNQNYDNPQFIMEILCFDTLPTISSFTTSDSSHYSGSFITHISGDLVFYNNTISDTDLIENHGTANVIKYTYTQGKFTATSYFYSNFDYRFTDTSYNYISFNSFIGTTDLNRGWLLPSSAPITTAYDYYELDFLNDYDTTELTEVNLNNYSYIVLSLKDYSSLPSPLNFQVKGQFCPTPVYNYGMNEKPSGSTEVCSPVYTDFTPVRFYVNQSDLDNHAVWYVAPLDTSIENKVKVDTSIFDISYITPENASNPTAIIGGKSYPILPYSSLSSTTTQNTEDGYIPGQSNNVFDVSSDSNFITNLFSNPLQSLSNVWQSIITMFSLIGSFIGLLPPVFQAFLFTAFSLALVIGIIKILL